MKLLGTESSASALYWFLMRPMLRFLWNSTRGHRIAPWRSPYLLWRIETYTGVKMTQIGFLEFWGFLWTERRELVALPEVDRGDGSLRPSRRRAPSNLALGN